MTHSTSLSNSNASQITEMLMSKMATTDSNNMWQGRAISLSASVAQALVFLRDHDQMALDAGSLRNYLILDNIRELSEHPKLPEILKQSLKSYLRSLPGYPIQSPNQPLPEHTYEQHGYIQMMLTRAASDLELQ